ncbi:MAG: MobA-like protein [Mucilaginibacter sp.]|jgi:molybdenum cofactor cytidylyltransferase|nr:MobA-like protein [Mucilaginibacter sp.]
MTGVIILAAGSSSRLGKPKQNLVFQGQTLLQKAIQNALNSVCENVIVVLGANAEMIQPTLTNQPVPVIYNPDWQEGMASSIRHGIAELQQSIPTTTAAILMLCDQPFADAAIINQLVQKKSASPKSIIASAYDGTIGVPALFDQSFFSELLQLTGNEGAKKLLLKYADEVVTIPFLLGDIDIDTVDDYERLGH